MPRNSDQTRRQILEAANSLFYREGIRAVSVDAVAASAGITKKSIYYHFESKDALVTEYLKCRDQPVLESFQQSFNTADGSIANKVQAIFTDVAARAQQPDWRGCGFMRTAGELANMPGHPARKAGAAHKKKFENWLTKELSQRDIRESSVLARRILILLDGAFAASLIHRDPDYILEAGACARFILETAHSTRS